MKNTLYRVFFGIFIEGIFANYLLDIYEILLPFLQTNPARTF